MNQLPGLRSAISGLALVGVIACHDEASLHASVDPLRVPVGTIPSSPRTIGVGERVTGTITGADGECLFTTEDGGWGGLCQAFEIPLVASGILETIVSWSDAVPLAVFVKTSNGAPLDMKCCNGDQLTVAVPVEDGNRYRLEVVYAGRPRGYPRIAPLSYALTTRLLPPDTSASAILRAILYADATRTQRMPAGRVEIIEGPLAGTAAMFDTISGTYDIRGVPRGYVQVRASADQFRPVTVRVPVGVSVARGIELTRVVPLADVSHSLSGLTWASPSSAHTGVKVEILDGPHAGVFTFSLEDWGIYEFRGLSPGRVRVRASGEGLISQTLEVMVSGATRLDFRW